MRELDFACPYRSARMPVLAENIVATSQPLAAQAGLEMLQAGGNAVDAALAAAITLTVVEPCSNGLGSDAFALVWHEGTLHGLNASGRAPKGLAPGKFAREGKLPYRGWDSVTVPGAVSAWVALSERFGAIPFPRLFERAIAYARDGYLVSPIVARRWADAAAPLAGFRDFADMFLPNGKPPRPGHRFRAPDLARSMEAIADSSGTAFYRGTLAEAMAAQAQSVGAALSEDDLESHSCEWTLPINLEYGEFGVHELPPNGQGIATLMALGMLRVRPLGELAVDSAQSVHLQIEAMKLAFADLYRYVADPTCMDVAPENLLEAGYLEQRASKIDSYYAREPRYGIPSDPGTVYVTSADEQGTMVSFIQSNYDGFGSGIVIPGTGISLQNRGAGFVLDKGHPNEAQGGKRPLHTIIPGFVTRRGQPLMTLGVMGGPMQPQGHVQMAVRVCDYGQNPQAAVDAPRWQVLGGRDIALEEGFSDKVVHELKQRGHRIRPVKPDSFAFGGAQLIYKLDGAYVAGSDPRKDGQAVGY